MLQIFDALAVIGITLLVLVMVFDAFKDELYGSDD